ncbi:MAG TPA: peptidylprolyl isomerase [Pseudobdellovibrionaceae bacterium]|nr:peptidylprolyl isomerase [Pseudobdellovibrionaceae bacterium]
METKSTPKHQRAQLSSQTELHACRSRLRLREASLHFVSLVFVSQLAFVSTVFAQVPAQFSPNLPPPTSPGLPGGVLPPTQGASQSPTPQPTGGGGTNFPGNAQQVAQPTPTPTAGTATSNSPPFNPPPSQIVDSPEPKSELFSAGQSSVTKPRITVSTSEGDFVIQLNPLIAPQNVYSFLELALGRKEFVDIRSGRKVTRPFYTGLSCHRVIRGTLIQCGCPFGTGRGGPGFTVPDEFSPGARFNRPGIVAMAPQQIEEGAAISNRKDSNGSQFFITLAPLPEFDDRFTIIGEIIEGWETIKKIALVPTSPTDRPIKRVIIFGMETFQPKATGAEAAASAEPAPMAVNVVETVRAEPMEPPTAQPAPQPGGNRQQPGQGGGRRGGGGGGGRRNQR